MSATFRPVLAGSAESPGAVAPATPRNVPNRGGTANPSAAALQLTWKAVVGVDTVSV